MAAPGLLPGDTKTRFGKHQEFFVVSVDVDRTSLASIKVEMHVQDEGLNNFSNEFCSLKFGVSVAGELGISDLIDIPADTPSAICVSVDRRYDRDGSMGIYTYTYEGLLQGRTPYIEYELEFTMNQEPIETHPNFEVFEPKFGPYNPIDRVWPRVPTAVQQQAGGLAGTTEAASQVVTNPMFGVSSFLSPGAVYRIMFCDITLKNIDLKGIGTKEDPIGLDQFPDFRDYVEQSPRDWLKMAPKIRKRGGAYQITMEWMLSGPRGWSEDLYSDAAINHAPGTGENSTENKGPNPAGAGPFGAQGP